MKQQSETVMRTEVRTISPALAREWLERNVNNRPISALHVRELAAEMAAGRWQLTHQGIAFDRAGALLDGQHRLRAIVLADMPIAMLVAYECERETFPDLDKGRKRANRDIVAMRGIPNAKWVASIARSCLCGMKKTKVPSGEVDEFVQANVEAITNAIPIARHYNAPVAGAFVNAHLSGWHGVWAAAQRLVDMAWEHERDPMNALARRLREMKSVKGQFAKYAVTVSALRAVHEGRSIATARETTVDFPLPHLGVVKAGEHLNGSENLRFEI